MIKVSSNAKPLAGKWLRRKAALDKARRTGLRNAAIEIDKAQVENLSGGDEVGGYPVAVRTGNLRGGHFFDVKRSDFAIIGNTTEYAMAIHTGNLTSRQGLSYSVKGRPFLDDAAESVDVIEHMAVAFRQEVLA